MEIKLTDKDFELIDEVLEDYKKNGTTDKKCPYCGKSMKYEECGNSYEVRCETDGCIREVFRGI